MGKTMESVFWHEVGHLIADLNNQNKLGFENFENHIELELATNPERPIEKCWVGATKALKINFSDSNDINEKLNKCAMQIACLAYGPILESVYLRQKGYAREDIIKDCWDLPNVELVHNDKKDKSQVRRILSDLEETELIIKVAWQANYSNQLDDFGRFKSVIDAVNEKIEKEIFKEAHRLKDWKPLAQLMKKIYVWQYLNEISENLFVADIALIKVEIFSGIKNEIDFNNFVRKIRDIIFNDK